MENLKETLQKIAELDSAVGFFVEHFSELNNESSCEWLPCLWFSNSISIEFETDSVNYRIYDPFGQVTSNYRNNNGWTNWSLSDPQKDMN